MGYSPYQLVSRISSINSTNHGYYIATYVRPGMILQVCAWIAMTWLAPRYSSASQGRAAPWEMALNFVDEMKAGELCARSASRCVVFFRHVCIIQ